MSGKGGPFFNTVVLPNFTCGLSVYGASDSDLTAIQSFLNKIYIS